METSSNYYSWEKANRVNQAQGVHSTGRRSCPPSNQKSTSAVTVSKKIDARKEQMWNDTQQHNIVPTKILSHSASCGIAHLAIALNFPSNYISDRFL